MAIDDRFRQDYREPDEDQPPGTRSEIITGPVSDWATDFSHLEPEWSADPYPIQDSTEGSAALAQYVAIRRRRGYRRATRTSPRLLTRLSAFLLLGPVRLLLTLK